MVAVKLTKGESRGFSASVPLLDTLRGWIGLFLVVARLVRLQQSPATCMHMPSSVSSLFSMLIPYQRVSYCYSTVQERLLCFELASPCSALSMSVGVIQMIQWPDIVEAASAYLVPNTQPRSGASGTVNRGGQTLGRLSVIKRPVDCNRSSL